MTAVTEGQLADRASPALSDGTRLRDLVNFESREVSLRVLSDPQIHALELRRIWGRSWVGIGHVAEIPEPGDFVLRSIGQDSVIVTRDQDGDVRVLLNVCAHRGMEVCWADSGNQDHFKCPYHGWVFDNSGKLLGAPFEQEMYGDWDKSGYGLRQARVAVRNGRIFGNLDPDAVSLDDWMGDAAWYLDRDFPDVEPDWDVLTTPRRWLVNANWKVSADNNSGDVYHGQSLHRSIAELGLSPDTGVTPIEAVKVATSGGHGITGFNMAGIMGTMQKDDPMFWDVDSYSFNCVMFPATFGIGGGWNQAIAGADGTRLLVAHTGSLIPRGPGRFEMWTAAAIDKRAPEATRAMLVRPGLLDLGGVDDMESWPSMQRVAGGALAQTQTMKYNARREPNPPSNWAGPGTVYCGISTDDNQWNFWLRWYEMMTTRGDAGEAG